MAYDQLLRLQPPEGADPRLLLVTVTEDDIQKLNFPISDQLLDQALGTLEADEPSIIGLDIYRDLPVEPGHKALNERLRTSSLIVPVCKGATKSFQGVAPPPGVPDEVVGFSDLVFDPDNVVRRSLLAMDLQGQKCRTTNSLGLQLALNYLYSQNIQPQRTPAGDFQLGAVHLRPLSLHDGSYHRIEEMGGYQLLLRYRSPLTLARTVSLSEVLEKRFQPEWVKDKVVLVGVSAPSAKDTFLTPFSGGQKENILTPGVVIHAQIVSQILSAVLDGRPLFWYLPYWAEGIWIWGWAIVGGLVAWRIRHPLRLGLAGGVALVGLFGTCFGLFLGAGWLPLVTPAIALVGTAAGVFAHTAYQAQQQQRLISQRVEEQDQAIALLQTLLKEVKAAPGIDSVDQLPQAIDSLNALLGGRYLVKKVLGMGGFSQTYLAEDTKRPGNPLCVVKRLRPARTDSQFLQVARRLFNSEAEILERLGQHNRIPQLLAYFEEHREFYLVEEYIEGHPLTDELVTGVHLPEAQALEITRGILEVLAFIHQHGVIHRDVKPGNVIRRHSDQQLVLIDFGAVKHFQPPEDGQPEENTIVIGTPGYAPAEQLSGQPALNSDVYAVGVTGIQALTGLSPKQFQKDLSTGEILWRHQAEVSPPFADILDKMVRYYFSDRYPSAAEVLHDLKRLG
jgi:CHASE2 domain-containing sensor protein/predicted Ser/Thr protein kinase